MALANTTQYFGSVTKALHWLMALLILILISLGWYANQLPFDTDAELARKAWLFSLHKTLGVVAFFVALLRILWALAQPKPRPLHPDRREENFAAALVHWLLYGAMVIVPLSGWISHAAASGFAPIWWPFGQDLPLVPKSTHLEHLAGGVHWVATKLLILALLLHLAGALKHQLIDGDTTLRRMLPGNPDQPVLIDTWHSRAPFWVALLIWALVLLAGANKPAPEGAHTPQTAPALAEVTSDWQVTEGNIALSVTQFGNTATGSFADWTAQINFDPAILTGKAGTVEAVISIPSLTLGSVTAQALGADFLNGADFPTARFVADILVASDGYEADGTLTLKDRSLPLRMPFALVVRDGRAEMRGNVTLDRRDFGVGDNIADEETLAFPVAIKVTLKATREETE